MIRIASALTACFFSFCAGAQTPPAAAHQPPAPKPAAPAAPPKAPQQQAKPAAPAAAPAQPKAAAPKPKPDVQKFEPPLTDPPVVSVPVRSEVQVLPCATPDMASEQIVQFLNLISARVTRGDLMPWDANEAGESLRRASRLLGKDDLVNACVEILKVQIKFRL